MKSQSQFLFKQARRALKEALYVLIFFEIPEVLDGLRTWLVVQLCAFEIKPTKEDIQEVFSVLFLAGSLAFFSLVAWCLWFYKHGLL